MAFLFGGARRTGTETVREAQRKAASNARGVEREIARLDRQEGALQRELAAAAKDPARMDSVTAKAKEIVRLRAQRGKLYKVKAHLTGLAQQLQTVHTSGRIQDTISETAQMLQRLNGRFDAAGAGRMLAEYERQNQQMLAKQELVDDALEAGFEADGEQEECDAAIVGVLQEAGLEAAARLAAGRMAQAAEALAQDDISPEGLAARLERLRP